MPNQDNHLDRRSYLKLAGVSAGAAVTGAQSGIVSANTGGYGAGGYGVSGYGLPSADSSVAVSTDSATTVEQTSVTLNVTPFGIGDASASDVGFEWGPAGSELTNTTSTQRVSATGSFAVSIDGLSPGTEYAFRAVATGTNGTSDSGATQSFTTLYPSFNVGDDTTLLPRDGRIVNASYDSKHDGYEGDGFVDFRSTDSYVQWNVENDTAADFDLTVRYALGKDDRTGRLSTGGVETELTTTSTGSWTTWETTTQRVSLPAGASTVRIQATGEDLGNIDSVRLRRVVPEEMTAQTLLPRDGQIVNAWYDSNHDGYQGDGYVNFRDTDSYVRWNVESPARADYDMTIRYALGKNDRTGRLTVDDTQQDVTAKSTGAWTSWETITKRVTLPAGISTLTVEAIGEDFGNVDAVYLTPPGESIPTVWNSKTLLPQDGEMVNAWYDSDHDGYQGDGYVNFRDTDSYVQWSVDNGEAAEFDLTVRYALGKDDRTGRLTVGDDQREVTIPSTGGWTNWETVTERVSLHRGTSTVRLEAIGEDFGNIDAVYLERVR